MSLARRHRETMNAALASGRAAPVAEGPAPMPTDGAGASEYQLLLAALGVDLNQLRNIESVERKIETKRGMIARYLPWVEGALSAGKAVQDEIVANMLVWAIDVGDWARALDIAAHVLEHGLSLPERYARKAATLIAEEFAEAGLKIPPQIDRATLLRVADLVADADIHDQVRAKLHKALGIAFKGEADRFDPEAESAVAGAKPGLIAAALDHLNRALALNPASGVKKMIETLEREHRKLPPQESKT